MLIYLQFLQGDMPMAKVSIDLKEIKKNIKTTADLAARQAREFAKKAQETKLEDILNNPQVKKLIENPKVQEFLKHEKVQELLNNPRVKEMTAKLTAKAQQVKSKVKKVANKRKTKKATSTNA